MKRTYKNLKSDLSWMLIVYGFLLLELIGYILKQNN